MKKRFVVICLLLSCLVVDAVEIKSSITSLPGELWYGAYTAQAFNGTALKDIVFQPFPSEYEWKDLRYDNNSNQAAPLLISNQGRYVWSERPFAFRLCDGNLELLSENEKLIAVSAGDCLRDAYLAAMQAHFPPTGRIPAKEFFLTPQYNTWIELGYNQSQSAVLKYAREIVENGFPVGVFMIDDQWSRYYGSLEFNMANFPNPKAMVDELHKLGFKVMLWVSPFISSDSAEFRELSAADALVCRLDNGKPDIIKWWNGYSACLDLTKETAVSWLRKKLSVLQEEYNIDGFKFDAVDFDFYTSKSKVFPNVESNAAPTEQCHLYTLLGTEYEFSEMRASWKGGNLPVSQRLQDKAYSWDDLQLIVPDMVSAGLIGLPYTCPDMVGGGLIGTFEDIDYSHFDQELMVRSAQVQAYMPMMQFSVAPWRVLDAEHLELCRQAALTHAALGDEILSMARQAAIDGEPIVRHMEYAFPHQGFENCLDQYMLGNNYLVAPMLQKSLERKVSLPKGTWLDGDGRKYIGGKTYTIEVPISKTLIFIKIK